MERTRFYKINISSITLHTDKLIFLISVRTRDGGGGGVVVGGGTWEGTKCYY